MAPAAERTLAGLDKRAEPDRAGAGAPWTSARPSERPCAERWAPAAVLRLGPPAILLAAGAARRLQSLRFEASTLAPASAAEAPSAPKARVDSARTSVRPKARAPASRAVCPRRPARAASPRAIPRASRPSPEGSPPEAPPRASRASAAARGSLPSPTPALARAKRTVAARAAVVLVVAARAAHRDWGTLCGRGTSPGSFGSAAFRIRLCGGLCVCQSTSVPRNAPLDRAIARCQHAFAF